MVDTDNAEDIEEDAVNIEESVPLGWQTIGDINALKLVDMETFLLTKAKLERSCQNIIFQK